MKDNTYFWLGIGIVIALVLVGGILLLRPRVAKAPTANTTEATTTAVDVGGGVIVNAPAGVTIKEIPVGVAAPNLNHQVSYSSSLPADAVAQLKSQIATITASLKTNPSQANQWLNLAINYKVAGDYTAAESVWVYLTKVTPNNYVVYGDLGDLYMNFKINYPKAEANYKAAIAINPQVIDYYRELYTLYTSFYKTNTTAAADIVAQGLKANPDNPDLLKLQTH